MTQNFPRCAVVLSMLCAAVLWSTVSFAQDDTYMLTIRDHRFEPTELHVPAGKRIKLTIKNLDATPEEFESLDLRREKIVAAHAEITVFIGPLTPGTYEFFGDFHQETARGRIIAK